MDLFAFVLIVLHLIFLVYLFVVSVPYTDSKNNKEDTIENKLERFLLKKVTI